MKLVELTSAPLLTNVSVTFSLSRRKQIEYEHFMLIIHSVFLFAESCKSLKWEYSILFSTLF